MRLITTWQSKAESKRPGNHNCCQKSCRVTKVDKEIISGDRNQKQKDEVREMRMSSDNKIVEVI